MPKPIELLSHDPLRYVGDMLAWVHQSICNEKEILQTLLKLCKEDGMFQTISTFYYLFTYNIFVNVLVLKEHLTTVLGQITEALCRPFKVRF